MNRLRAAAFCWEREVGSAAGLRRARGRTGRLWGDGLGAEGDEVGVVGGGEGVDGFGGGEGPLAEGALSCLENVRRN